MMKSLILPLAIACALSLRLGAAEHTSAVPPAPERLRVLRSTHTAVSPQNPYLPLAVEIQRLAWPRVRAALQGPATRVNIDALEDDLSVLNAHDAFWVVWSAFAPEGPHRADAPRRTEAVAVLDLWTTLLEKKPTGLWDTLPVLEAVDIAYASSRDGGALKRWLERLRPSVEATYRNNREHKKWSTWTPNPLIQSTPILALAAELFAAANPTDAAPALWRAMARECLHRALPLQLPGGAFTYMVDSGPDPNYYDLDSTFLGRYWQVTGDPDALGAVQRMAGYSRSATVSGKLDAVASPYWKHMWQSVLRESFHAPEIIATLAGDPVTKAVANRRLAQGNAASMGLGPGGASRATAIERAAIARAVGKSAVYYTYYALRFWDGTVPAQPLDQRSEFDLNSNGPALRSGSFDVIMPARPWTDATFGVSIASAKRLEAFLSSTRLALYAPGQKNLPSGSGTFCMTYSDDVPRHASIVRENWIASGWHYTPRRTTNGNRENALPGPAERTDLWFADASGAGGVVSLQVREATPPMEPAGWLLLSSSPEQVSAAPGLKVGPLHLELGGDFVEKELVDQPVNLSQPMVGLKLSLKGSQPQSWQPGTRFHYSLSAWPEQSRKWTVSPPRFNGAIVQVELQRQGEKRVLLVYNSSHLPAKWLPDEDFTRAWMSLTQGIGIPVSVGKGSPVTLPAYTLVVGEKELKE